jgi:hypothetical protein
MLSLKIDWSYAKEDVRIDFLEVAYPEIAKHDYDGNSSLLPGGLCFEL